MVNVAQYQIVATGSTVSACEQAYIKMLNEKGLAQQEQLPSDPDRRHGGGDPLRRAGRQHLLLHSSRGRSRCSTPSPPLRPGMWSP